MLGIIICICSKICNNTLCILFSNLYLLYKKICNNDLCILLICIRCMIVSEIKTNEHIMLCHVTGDGSPGDEQAGSDGGDRTA